MVIENLARGHHDSEVGDGSLRREAKSLRELLFEGTLDRIKLTVLCAAASSHQAVANAINFDPGERLLDHCLLAGIQGFRRHVNRGDVNPRIEPLQEAVGELRFPIQFHGLLRYVSVTVKFERQHRVDAAVRSIWHCESPLSCRARTARGDGSCQSLRCPCRKPNPKISARQLSAGQHELSLLRLVGPHYLRIPIALEHCRSSPKKPRNLRSLNHTPSPSAHSQHNRAVSRKAKSAPISKSEMLGGTY